MTSVDLLSRLNHYKLTPSNMFMDACHLLYTLYIEIKNVLLQGVIPKLLEGKMCVSSQNIAIWFLL